MRRSPARSACGDERRQHRAEVGRREARAVARWRRPTLLGRPARKSSSRWAGARNRPPPARNAARSIRALELDAGQRAGARPGRSRRRATETTSPAFANGESRRDRLMPLTTTPSGSVAAGTIQPPGHMQKL